MFASTTCEIADNIGSILMLLFSFYLFISLTRFVCVWLRATVERRHCTFLCHVVVCNVRHALFYIVVYVCIGAKINLLLLNIQGVKYKNFKHYISFFETHIYSSTKWTSRKCFSNYAITKNSKIEKLPSHPWDAQSDMSITLRYNVRLNICFKKINNYTLFFGEPWSWQNIFSVSWHPVSLMTALLPFALCVQMTLIYFSPLSY